MNAQDIRTRYFDYMKERDHAPIPRAHLIPQDDATTLFTGSGMQPLLPYLLGSTHPEGVRLVNSQTCLRAEDIEEVGDNRHTTFFEMLGNWSLGDYFKEEQLRWFFEFLTEEVGLDPKKLYVTTFSGDEALGLPKDTESADIWQRLFDEKGVKAEVAEIGSEAAGAQRGMQKGERIFSYDGSKNWWSRSGGPQQTPTGDPCGPDSEVFYEFSGIDHDEAYGANCHPNCDCGRFLEIGNSVFMQYVARRKVILSDAIYCLISETGELNVELADLLESTGAKVIVVTNAEPDDLRKKLEGYSFEVFSLRKDPEKTDPAYFERLIKEYGLEHEDVLYFDHLEDNLKAATEHGITTGLYKGDVAGVADFLSANRYLYFEDLPKKNVDFGGGLERIAAAAIDSSDVFQISLLKPIIEGLEEVSGVAYEEHTEPMRVIADHLRAAVFLAVDGVMPSNKEQGYVARRLMRRAIKYAFDLDIHQDLVERCVPLVVDAYKKDFPEVASKADEVLDVLKKEESVFRQTLRKGIREFEKLAGDRLDGETAFKLYDTYGFPSELSVEEASKRGVELSSGWQQEFEAKLEEQRQRSRTATKGQFKGGLGGDSDIHKKYHTATHLMYRALREVLGEHVVQKGSNITDERLRFDFTHPEKMTDEEKQKVEELVNQRIDMNLKVGWEELPTDEALERGAYGAFGDTYGETVKVYSMSDEDGHTYSFEICGGPHVERTGELAEDGKTFKITKEESSSAGVRRIKAVLT